MVVAISIVVASLIIAFAISSAAESLKRAVQDQTQHFAEVCSKLEAIRHCSASQSEYFRQEFEERREHRRALEALRNKEIDARIKQAEADGTLRIFED